MGAGRAASTEGLTGWLPGSGSRNKFNLCWEKKCKAVNRIEATDAVGSGFRSRQWGWDSKLPQVNGARSFCGTAGPVGLEAAAPGSSHL